MRFSNFSIEELALPLISSMITLFYRRKMMTRPCMIRRGMKSGVTKEGFCEERKHSI
jgi:hypothetical protein